MGAAMTIASLPSHHQPLPCRCGGQASLQEIFGKTGWWVDCSACGRGGPGRRLRLEAAVAWNIDRLVDERCR